VYFDTAQTMGGIKASALMATHSYAGMEPSSAV